MLPGNGGFTDELQPVFWAFTTLQLLLQTTRFLVFKVSSRIWLNKHSRRSGPTSTACFAPKFPSVLAAYHLTPAVDRIAVSQLDSSDVERWLPVCSSSGSQDCFGFGRQVRISEICIQMRNVTTELKTN